MAGFTRNSKLTSPGNNDLNRARIYLTGISVVIDYLDRNFFFCLNFQHPWRLAREMMRSFFVPKKLFPLLQLSGLVIFHSRTLEQTDCKLDPFKKELILQKVDGWPT